MYSVADGTPVFCGHLSISFLWPLKHPFSVVNGIPVLDFPTHFLLPVEGERLLRLVRWNYHIYGMTRSSNIGILCCRHFSPELYRGTMMKLVESNEP
jgi:hypothetical protein